ncbi:phytoene desaturase [Hyphomicrobium sp. ghe19]|uniref:phytoene desaturase n=1 Tax=Hyphomicrobium sp. ghe19 TaxID=2682968 RepID=UPI0013677560|nr:Phytoene desaturase (neurosporene-forming) [Hyphomicrobium sp. ghe19]
MLAPNSDRPHAIIIGSGFGGLAAAVRLGARGYRVTILEKLDCAGGRASVFRQDGFTFDAGPTIVTAPFLFEELWRLCGRELADDVELKPLTPFYRIRFDDGGIFNCCGDPKTMRDEVARFSPEDVNGYERFMRLAEDIYAIGFEQLGHVPFTSLWDMARVLPELIRLKSYRSVHALVSKHVRDPRIRFVLSFHSLFIGGNPFNVTSIYGLISFLERRWGVHFPMGGMGKLVEGLVRLIEEQGGEIRYDAEVQEILIDGKTANGVRLANGKIIKSDIVVSNADSAWTYHNLLPERARRRWNNRKLDKGRYSMGLFVWYFGTSRCYPEIPHHMILLGPRYRELLQDIFQKKHLADDMSLYLHRPTATDPALAPEGCDAFYVLSPVPNLDAKIDWETKAEAYRRAIAERLNEVALPGFEKHIVTSRTMSPLDFQHRLLSYKGAGFGLEPVLTQSAWFRPHNRSEDIENLYLVGAGTHPGAGVPGVLSSARILETIVPDAAAFKREPDR